MAHKSLSFKKKQHFLQLIKDIPTDRILFCPVDVSKHFHVALLHDIRCQPLSDFFEFSASKIGFASFTDRLEAAFTIHSPQLVLIGMEPTSVYYEGLLHNLRRRYATFTTPKLQLCIIDPAAVKENRRQHSLRTQKTDQIDAAAIGELLTRGLYTPAYFSSPQAILIKEVARSLNDHRHQMLALWNRLLTRLDRVFPNLLINYRDEKPFAQQPLQSKLLDDLLHLCPDPYLILDLTTADLIELFHQQDRPLGPKRAEKIIQAAQRALLPPKALHQVHLQLFKAELETLDFLKAQIAKLERQLEQLIIQSPARHLPAIAGNSAKLTAELIAALEDWQRYETIQPVWAAAGFAPIAEQSGSSSAKPKISKRGSVHLRNAIYKMTCSVIWHEPTFGIPCFQRLLNHHPFVPTILHVGRKLTGTALAILKADRAFHPPIADYSLAKEKLSLLQQQYLKQKKQTASQDQK